ncbi:MAG: LamG domain-containing protein [Planctomycetes bacterium]|nr:LamG domain-containing protein [Planctomycetota bacterium]
MFKKMIYLVSVVLVLGLVSSVSAGLVAHWQFDEGSGTTAVDSSGNSHDGTLLGDPEWVAGMIGNGALSFDGSDGLVDVGHDESLSITDELTITVWVKAGDLSNYYFLVCKQPSGTAGDNYPGNYEFRIQANSGILEFGHQEAEGEQYTFYTSDTSITADQWYHVAVVVTKGELVEFYIDGVSAGSAEQLTNFGVLNDEPVRIGGRKDGYSFFNGILDDVRLYDRALSAVQIQKMYNGNPPMFTVAEKPDPADGALHSDTWASISWRAGDYAVSHDVYFGVSFDDVNAGAESTFQGNQVDTFFVAGFPGFAYPDGLVPGTTYYWRVDEVNDTESDSPWKGDVWSFSIPPKTAYNPVPANSVESVDPNAELSWTTGFGAKLHTVYFGNNFDEVDNAAGGLPQGTASYTPGTLKMAKTYYWRVDEFDVVETHKGDVWSFTTEGAVASLEPANGAVDVTQTPVLTWAPGLGASYEVYFGADEASLELKGSGNLGSESYEPGQLEWDTTYYWRVDEANATNTDSPWTGPLWSFTTANFLIIEDFESYNDLDPADPASNRIFNAWLDGFDNPALNGSVVGNANPPFAEQTIVHSGNQSMPLAYDNAVGKSEATLTLTSQRDWTVKSVNTLTIWFRGESGNAAETLYVALNDSAVVTNDNPDAALATSWTAWNIDLTRFTDQGVNLANVNSITLGLGDRENPVAGGAGMMYFDDIRLYPPAP